MKLFYWTWLHARLEQEITGIRHNFLTMLHNTVDDYFLTILLPAYI